MKKSYNKNSEEYRNMLIYLNIVCFELYLRANVLISTKRLVGVVCVFLKNLCDAICCIVCIKETCA